MKYGGHHPLRRKPQYPYKFPPVANVDAPPPPSSLKSSFSIPREQQPIPARSGRNLSGPPRFDRDNTPEEIVGGQVPQLASLHDYTLQNHCHGLFELPIAA